MAKELDKSALVAAIDNMEPIKNGTVEYTISDGTPEEMNGEKQIYCTKDRLAILGTAPTMPETPWHDEELEIWALSQCATFPAFVRADILFELHADGYWASDANIIPRINTWPGRMVMQEKYDYVPNSEKFPIETVLKYKRYHRTTLTYLLALALHSRKVTGKPGKISLYGVHMEDVQEEYGEQRPCCEYWLGRLEDSGVEIFLAGGAILSAPFLYGYEKYSPLALQLRKRMDGLLAGQKQREDESFNARLKASEQFGAANENRFLLRQLQRGELQLADSGTLDEAEIDSPHIDWEQLTKGSSDE